MAPGYKRSDVWEHFRKRNNDIVLCNICKKEFKYCKNTSNMREHLKRKHPAYIHTFSVSTVRTNEERTVISNDDISESFVAAVSSPDNAKNDIAVEPTPKRQKQLRLHSIYKTDELSQTERNDIDRSLIEMIVKDYQPLSIVENQGFLNYSKKLQPLYTPPTRKHLVSKLLPDLYEEVKLKVQCMLKDAAHVAVTTDMWTSDSNKSFLAVTSHYIYNEILHASLLSSEEFRDRHTGENIAAYLQSVFRQWDIENKVHVIVTDNAKNMKHAVSDILKLRHHPCVAHTLNLSVNEALNSNTALSTCIKKCRTIVAHFKSSCIASEKSAAVNAFA